MKSKMTKAQAVKALVKLGCTDIQPSGKFCILATLPDGYRGLFDPRDLLAELQAISRLSQTYITAVYERSGELDGCYHCGSLQHHSSDCHE
jgi:hypothetical protein